MKIASVIITYNRILDAKIQMDLIKNLWSREKKLSDIDIYHSFNGPRKLYPKKYIEKHLTRCANPGFYEGAALLINTAISKIFKQKVNYDFIIVTSADVWLTRPRYILRLLKKMQNDKFHLATSTWFQKNLYSTEFLVITPRLAKDIFPINLGTENHLSILWNNSTKIKDLKIPVLEYCFANKVKEVFEKNPKKYLSLNKSVYFIPGRKRVHFLNRHCSPIIGYYSQHNINNKIFLVGKKLLMEYSPTIKNTIFNI